MGRSIYYRLERCDNGTWWADRREFLPTSCGIVLSPYVSGSDSGLNDLAWSISQTLKALSQEGFPPQASVSLRDEADRMFKHQNEECEPLPLFGWVSVEDILAHDWSAVAGGNERNRQLIEQWLVLLRSLGPAEMYRVVCFWL